MSDIFIAHVEEDAEIALEIALNLEVAGYTTWCYEVDSMPGPSYLLQTGQAVSQTKAVVVIISPHSISSNQVTKEIVRAHESGSQFIPILHDITHIEFQTRQPEWREAIGAATSISIPPEGVVGIISNIIGGLQSLKVNPSWQTETGHTTRIRRYLEKIRAHGPLESPLQAATSGIEAVSGEIPPTKIYQKARKWQKWLMISSASAIIVALIIVVVILLGRDQDSQDLAISPPTSTPTTMTGVTSSPSTTTTPTAAESPTITPTTPISTIYPGLSLSEASTLLDLTTLLPPSFEKQDAALMGFSNADLELGPDFSEVELFVSYDYLQFIVGYMAVFEDSLTGSIFDTIFQDDQQVKDLILEGIVMEIEAEGLSLDDVDVDIQMSRPSIGDIAVLGEGYMSTVGWDMGFDLCIFREKTAYVYLMSISFSTEKVSLEPIAKEIADRIDNY